MYVYIYKYIYIYMYIYIYIYIYIKFSFIYKNFKPNTNRRENCTNFKKVIKSKNNSTPKIQKMSQPSKY